MLSAALALLVLASPVPQEDPYRIPFEDEVAAAATFDQATLDAKMAEILPRLVELRGWQMREPVLAGVQTVEEFMAFAAQAMAEEYGPEGMAGMMASAVMLGLLPADQDLEKMMNELLEASVGGYYDPKTSKFWIMAGFSQGPMADLIMAHELQHALDDQRYPLDPLLGATKGNSDRQFAARCVVEGSASSAMNLYMVKAMTEGWLPPGELMSGDMISSQMTAMAEAPVSFLAALVLPYIEGPAFLLRGGTILDSTMRAPALEDLDRAFTELPQSSEQILHPEKYWDPEKLDPPRAIELPDRSADLGAGWTCVDEDTLGEIGCALLAAERLPSAMELQFGAAGLRIPAAAGWGGDRYRCYRNEEGARILHARIEWDTEADAGEFAAAMQRPAVRDRMPFLVKSVHESGSVNRSDLVFADKSVAKLAGSLLGSKK